MVGRNGIPGTQVIGSTQRPALGRCINSPMTIGPDPEPANTEPLATNTQSVYEKLAGAEEVGVWLLDSGGCRVHLAGVGDEFMGANDLHGPLDQGI